MNKKNLAKLCLGLLLASPASWATHNSEAVSSEASEAQTLGNGVSIDGTLVHTTQSGRKYYKLSKVLWSGTQEAARADCAAQGLSLPSTYDLRDLETELKANSAKARALLAGQSELLIRSSSMDGGASSFAGKGKVKALKITDGATLTTSLDSVWESNISTTYCIK